jgi:hypothetical protein
MLNTRDLTAAASPEECLPSRTVPTVLADTPVN